MSTPVIARPRPCLVQVKAGRTYWWCSCGRSTKQPFCDGSHQGSEFSPVPFKADQDDELLFCGCKHTHTAPFCDGAHNNVPGGSPLDDPLSAPNRAIPSVTERDGPRTLLNGCCYVFSCQLAEMQVRGSLRYCYMVSTEQGAQFQTQILMEASGEPSPILRFDSSDVILFISTGAGLITIAGRQFPVAANTGVYIRPGEAIQLTATAGDSLRVFLVASPSAEILWLDAMPDSFDARYPERVVTVDPRLRTSMGPRYYQMLVDKRIGSSVITQFIGHIPPSKGAPHRHLYEETITVLSGEGYMWTQDRKAPVKAGDVIFLPRKQLHSLEATSADGIDVVGVICPGDNPSVNYYD